MQNLQLPTGWQGFKFEQAEKHEKASAFCWDWDTERPVIVPNMITKALRSGVRALWKALLNMEISSFVCLAVPCDTEGWHCSASQKYFFQNHVLVRVP